MRSLRCFLLTAATLSYYISTCQTIAIVPSRPSPFDSQAPQIISNFSQNLRRELSSSCSSSATCSQCLLNNDGCVFSEVNNAQSCDSSGSSPYVSSTNLLQRNCLVALRSGLVHRLQGLTLLSAEFFVATRVRGWTEVYREP